MIKVAIIDDNKTNAEEVQRLLGEFPSNLKFDIKSFCDPESFINDARENVYNIAFIDIMLGEKSGIEAGEEFAKLYPHSVIIFMSANPEYFKDVYKVPHIYFLTKEFERERFFDAVAKATENIKKETLTIETKNGTYKISLKDILCFESRLKHTVVYYEDGSCIEYNVNLKDIETLLPENGFVRVHQSFIVNMSYITKYDRKSVVLKDMKTVPISRSHNTEAREAIVCWLGGSL